MQPIHCTPSIHNGNYLPFLLQQMVIIEYCSVQKNPLYRVIANEDRLLQMTDRYPVEILLVFFVYDLSFYYLLTDGMFFLSIWWRSVNSLAENECDGNNRWSIGVFPPSPIPPHFTTHLHVFHPRIHIHSTTPSNLPFDNSRSLSSISTLNSIIIICSNIRLIST